MTIGNELGLTTGIGSLPHHNIDAAIEFAFRMDVPFLPQIPIRNPWEYMIPQALEGLPGLQVEKEGQTRLDTELWAAAQAKYQLRLDRAFAHAEDPLAFESFEPSSAASSCWQPFLWELQERGLLYAKIQIAGPMTSQWALNLKDGRPADCLPELSSQIFRTVLARALAMTRKLKAQGVRPLLYLDEPGLYGLTLSKPRHVVGFQELRLLIETLRKENVEVGLHCCSNTDWDLVLSLNLNFLSMDSELSLAALLTARHARALEAFFAAGRKLSLGIIHTREYREHATPEELFLRLLETIQTAGTLSPARVSQVLREALFTPACGLALHPPADAEAILTQLHEFSRFAKLQLASEPSPA